MGWRFLGVGMGSRFRRSMSRTMGRRRSGCRLAMSCGRRVTVGGNMGMANVGQLMSANMGQMVSANVGQLSAMAQVDCAHCLQQQRQQPNPKRQGENQVPPLK